MKYSTIVAIIFTITLRVKVLIDNLVSKISTYYIIVLHIAGSEVPQQIKDKVYKVFSDIIHVL